MYLKALFYCVILLSANFTFAQSTREEIEQLKYDSEDLIEQIEYFEKSLIDLSDALDLSRQDLAKQEEALAKQKDVASTSSDAAEQRSLNLIENAVLMKKHSISRQERRVARQTSKLEQSREELIATYKKIAEKEAILARAASQPKVKPAPKPAPQPVVKPAEPAISPPQIVQSKPEPEVKNTTVSTAAPISKEVESVSETTAPVSEDNPDSHSFSEDELDEVQDIMDKLAPRLARDPGRPILRNVFVQAKGIPTTEMTFLGENQYRADIVLPAGSLSIEINGRRYREEIEEKDAEKEHVFLLDAKRFDRQRLYVFRHDILKYVDAPIE